MTLRQPTTFQSEFNCLWCGRLHRTRTDSDLEGYAQLCPDCVGRAGENEFLRFRLKDGREFEIIKVFYEPVELRAALETAGFNDIEVTQTSRFFVLGRATA